MAGGPRDPGWYPDQNDPELNRYWNGRAWTARRQPVDAPVDLPQDEPTQPRRATMAGAAPASRTRIPVWLWVIGALMLLRSVGGLVAAFQDPGPGPSSTVLPHASSVSTPAPGH